MASVLAFCFGTALGFVLGACWVALRVLNAVLDYLNADAAEHCAEGMELAEEVMTTAVSKRASRWIDRRIEARR